MGLRCDILAITMHKASGVSDCRDTPIANSLIVEVLLENKADFQPSLRLRY
jgi:hypothetical protein